MAKNSLTFKKNRKKKNPALLASLGTSPSEARPAVQPVQTRRPPPRKSSPLRRLPPAWPRHRVGRSSCRSPIAKGRAGDLPRVLHEPQRPAVAGGRRVLKQVLTCGFSLHSCLLFPNQPAARSGVLGLPRGLRPLLCPSSLDRSRMQPPRPHALPCAHQEAGGRGCLQPATAPQPLAQG